ncbi:RHS repeat protein, partial [candidate division FCPU426 bacterium]|nr:RHS repeat protein [candidate division FCPU426 bacterium]
MTYKYTSQLDSQNPGERAFFFCPRFHWLIKAAALGTLLLFAGVSLSAAEVSDKLLPNILRQLKDQGKRVKASSVIEITDGEAMVTITLMTGEVRKYDSSGRLKEVIQPDGEITLYEDGMPVMEKSASGEIKSETKYFKSADGRLRKTVKTSKTGAETKLYDSKGNVVQQSSPQGTKFFSNYVKNDKGKTVQYFEREMNTGKTNFVLMDPETGQVVAKIDQNGVRTDITTIKNSDGEMIATIEENSRGNRKEKKYDNGQVVEEIENGIRTVHENILNEKGVLVMKKETKLQPSRGGVIEDVTTKEFNEYGQIVKKTDKEGEHTYKYVLDKDGRIQSRIETTRSLDGSFDTKQKTTDYDNAGRIVRIKEGGRTVEMSYVTDDKGNILSSTETVTTTIGWQTFTQTFRKEYDEQGHVTAKTDQFGLRTDYTYDDKGNKTSSINKYETSEYKYDESGNLLLTITKDHRSTTYTWHDPQTQLPVRKVKVLNNGVVQTTTYGEDELGRRVSYTQEAFGIRVNIYRDGQSEQPLQTIFTKNNGKKTVTDYQYSGDAMVYSKETGEGSVSETRYNGMSKPEETVATDRWGRVTKTTYTYLNGRMMTSLSEDEKGESTTKYNEYEQPEEVIRINRITFPRKSKETRIYKDGILVEAVSRNVKSEIHTFYDENEQPDMVHTRNRRGFPRQNWVKNIYNSSGEMTESYQIDSRGFTANTFDGDGLMSLSIRLDVWGYPKMKTTTYEYEKGEMVRSRVDDERGYTNNEFDRDGLMRKSTRNKYVGYPRVEESTYEYDGDAYMIYSETRDENGFTQNWYNPDELVAVTYRENFFGHARQMWTVNEYNSEGFMTLSKQTDLKGCTISLYNKDSLVTANIRYDEYGVIYGRITLSFNEYDDKGFMTKSKSKNLLTSMEKEFDKDTLCRYQVQHDNYGIHNTRHKETTNYIYDDHGRMQTNISADIMGTTFSMFDIHGDAIWTRRFANFGAELGRVSTTQSAYEADTGMTLWSYSISGLNEVLTINSDDRYALPELTYTHSYRGAELGRNTEGRTKASIYHGLTEVSYSKNGLNEVTTWHSLDDLGVPKLSFTHGYYGAEWGRDTWAWIDTDEDDGMTNKSLSLNKLCWAITIYGQDDHRLPVMSFTHNFYGAEYGRDNWARIISNPLDGMTDENWSFNKLSISHTVHAQDDEYRLPEMTESWNFRGARLGRYTKTEIMSNKRDGYTDETFSRNGLNETRTIHSQEDTWRLPVKSYAHSYRGAEMGRDAVSDITTNHFDGFTDKVVAVTDLSTVTTYHATNSWRLPWLSKTHNNLGAEWGRDILSLIDSDHLDGMTNASFAMSKLNWTLTEYSKDEFRHPHASKSWSFRGALMGRFSQSQIFCSEEDGMTDMTISETDLATTTTWNQSDEWRLPGLSKTENKRGAILGRLTWTIIDANKDDGNNDETFAYNALNWTRTKFATDEWRLSEFSESYNYRGAEDGRYTQTKITSNHFDGYTDETLSWNKLTVVKTVYSTDSFRMADHSETWSSRGAEDGRYTYTKITNSHLDGFTNMTVAETALSKVTTWHKQDSKYRLPWFSRTESKKGAEFGRLTLTFIESDIMDGMTNESFAMNRLNFTKTIHSRNDEWRLPMESLTWSFRGALLGRFTHTAIRSNHKDGYTDETFAKNGLNWTRTVYSKNSWRLPESSETWGFRGARNGRYTTTQIMSNIKDGFTDCSISENGLNRTVTLHRQNSWRLPFISFTDNKLGAEYGKHVTTYIDSNIYDGATDSTYAVSGLNHVYTHYSGYPWRMPDYSRTWTWRGALGGRYTFSRIESDHYDGNTNWTVSVNALSTTTTWHGKDEFRAPKWSKTVNKRGAELGRVTWSAIFTDPDDGMTNTSIAVNRLNIVVTNYSKDNHRLPMESHTYSFRG